MADRNKAMMDVMNYMHELTNMMILQNETIEKQNAEGQYSFQEVMRQWSRMCAIPKSYGGICSSKQDGYICPMKSNGMCNKTLTDQTDADREKGEAIIMSWAAEHPVVYPTWGEWLQSMGVAVLGSGMLSIHPAIAEQPIPAELAEKLEIEPKEG